MRWWSDFSDRARKFWLGVLVVYAIVAPIVMIIQNVEIRSAQVNTHNLQHSINRGLSVIVPELIGGQAVLIHQYANLLAQETWIECAVSMGPANCGPIPKLGKT